MINEVIERVHNPNYGKPISCFCFECNHYYDTVDDYVQHCKDAHMPRFKPRMESLLHTGVIDFKQMKETLIEAGLYAEIWRPTNGSF